MLKNGLCTPFFLSEARLERPHFRILPFTHSSEDRDLPIYRGRGHQDTYWALGAVVAAVLAAVSLLFVFPHDTGAFWFFSASEAAEGGTNGAVIHDASLGMLKAAVNIDPNPYKNGFLIAMTGGSALLSDVGLEGTVDEGVSKNGRISLYVVRAGDSLSEIAEMFEVSGNTILWANNLKSAKEIRPGDTLVILPVSGIEHVV